MLVGCGLPVSGAWAGPRGIAHFGALAERLGYHSVWTFQRLLAPADNSVDPGYRSVLDPVVSLAFAAAHTTTVRLGVAVVNVPFVPPVLLAKQASTVDVLSGGRLDLGLGTGWSPEEFAASGASTRRRGARAEEYLAVLPKPVQRPGPPVLLGGSVPAALRRAGRLADGWVSRSATDLSAIAADIAVVRGAAEEAGRDPSAVRVVCRGVLRPGPRLADDQGRPVRLSGSFDDIRADTAWLGEQGVTEVFYDLNWDPLVGAPDADPAAAADRAEHLLDALRPAR
jgi:alkanesulfonate monooxygenase SsuD/methylene tetrahydromethanopterin reductase-like flavin-dependent oxidoreductase (luciferase family)